MVLFIRSYLQTRHARGDHSMRSFVLPWYPGGHVLSKMQGRHLYLQDRHGEGSKAKKLRRLQPYQRVPQENRRRRNT